MDGISCRDGSRFPASAWLLFGILLAPVSLAGAANAGRIVVDDGDAPEGMNFFMEVQEALAYLSADPVLEDVLSLGARIEIRHTAGRTRMQFRPRDGSALILFNPRMGIRIDNRGIQSPALVLGHELGHVLRGLRGVTGTRNGRFTVAEEIAVIEEIEQRVARLKHEPVRRRWQGTAVETGSVTMGRSPGSQVASRITLARSEDLEKRTP